MSDAYERAKTGRLIFKGGVLATNKSISKKKKKTKKPTPSSPNNESQPSDQPPPTDVNDEAEPSSDIYTIDAARKMKYDDLFPVEAKKFGYDPKAKATSVEQALDDRVKKKADRYCK